MYRIHTLPKKLALGAAVAIAAAVAVSPVIAPSPALAATSEELQSELDAARAELSGLDEQIMSATRDLEIAQSDLEQTEADIETVSASIDENEAELAEKRTTLSALMTDNYKSSGSMISFILGSTSFDELISRVFYANRMSDSLSGTIGEVVTLQAELDAERSELEQKRADQEEQTERLSETAASYQVARSEQAAYVDNLSAEVQEALEAERQAELERQRQEAEAALRAEQEAMAAQQQQEQEQAQGGDAPSVGDETNDGSTGGASDGTTELPSTPSTPSQPSNAKQAAVSAAMSVLGTPYVTNGSSPSQGFDCSGLVWWAYQQAGVSIPRSQRSGMYPQVLASGTWTTNPANLAVGDLVFYSFNGGASTYHVAMYIGNNNVIHANGLDVCITSIYYDTGFIGGGSIL